LSNIIRMEKYIKNSVWVFICLTLGLALFWQFGGTWVSFVQSMFSFWKNWSKVHLKQTVCLPFNKKGSTKEPTATATSSLYLFLIPILTILSMYIMWVFYPKGWFLKVISILSSLFILWGGLSMMYITTSSNFMEYALIFAGLFTLFLIGLAMYLISTSSSGWGKEIFYYLGLLAVLGGLWAYLRNTNIKNSLVWKTLEKIFYNKLNLALFVFFFACVLFYIVNPNGFASKYVGVSLFLVLFLLGYLAIQAQTIGGGEGTGANMLSLLGIIIGIGVIIGMFAYLASIKSTWVTYAIALIGLTLLYQLVSKIHSPILQLFLSAVFWIPCLLVKIVDAFLLALHPETTPFVQNLSFFLLLLLEIVLIIISQKWSFSVSVFSSSNLLDILPTQSFSLNTATSLPIPEHLTNHQLNLNAPLQNFSFSWEVYLNGNTTQTTYLYDIINIGDLVKFQSSADGQHSVVQVKTSMDTENHEILLPKGSLPLQKYVPVQLRFNGGILDILVNHQVVKSTTNIIIIGGILLQTLTIGQEGGLHGKVRRVSFTLS